MRRSSRLIVWLVLVLAAGSAVAQDLESACHATSSYDVTLQDGSVLFDRPTPAPMRVELQHGTLRTDGVQVKINAENQDRLVLFQRELEALVPKVRKVAQNGVDIAASALRSEADGMGLSTATRDEFQRRLAAHADELKQRIARSRSSHDWQGDLATQYANEVAADVLPLLAGDLGQQAINAALSGDLQAAASLRDRAASLTTDLKPRLMQRMQVLRPQIDALCPSIQRLANLQQGVPGLDGRPLRLLQVDEPGR